jgi:hypothetical protein
MKLLAKLAACPTAPKIDEIPPSRDCAAALLCCILKISPEIPLCWLEYPSPDPS